MTIPIISDSHGYGRRVLTVTEKLGHIGEYPRELIFLGDGTRELLSRVPEGIRVYAVKGNCDNFGGAVDIDIIDNDGFAVPEERLEILDGVRVLMIHGHRYFVKGGMGAAIARAAALEADLLLFGHTHHPIYTTLPAGSKDEGGGELKKTLHIFNPGALCEGSFGILTVRGGEILMSHGRV